MQNRLIPLAVATLTCLALCGCASHPEIVPEIDSSRLPRLKLPGLSPRVLELSVENERSVNKQFGNSAQVAQAVYSNVADAISKAGVKVQASKSNHFTITITDCKDAPEGAECVLMKGKLEIPGWRLGMESQGMHGFSREGSSRVNFGDISEAYQNTLQGLLGLLDRQLQEVTEKRKK